MDLKIAVSYLDLSCTTLVCLSGLESIKGTGICYIVYILQCQA